MRISDWSSDVCSSDLVKDGRERLGGRELPTATDLKSLTGRGVTAIVDGETVWIGKAEMFGVEGIPTLNAAATDAIAILREGGRTTMVVRKGDKDIGARAVLIATGVENRRPALDADKIGRAHV